MSPHGACGGRCCHTNTRAARPRGRACCTWPGRGGRNSDQCLPLIHSLVQRALQSLLYPHANHAAAVPAPVARRPGRTEGSERAPGAEGPGSGRAHTTWTDKNLMHRNGRPLIQGRGRENRRGLSTARPPTQQDSGDQSGNRGSINQTVGPAAASGRPARQPRQDTMGGHERKIGRHESQCAHGAGAPSVKHATQTGVWHSFFRVTAGAEVCPSGRAGHAGSVGAPQAEHQPAAIKPTHQVLRRVAQSQKSDAIRCRQEEKAGGDEL